MLQEDENQVQNPSDPMALMMQMQKQQIEMQQQMTILMSQVLNKENANAGETRRSAPKLERPSIDADASDNKWVISTDAWKRFKEMAKLSDAKEIRNELRSACSSTVNEYLYNFVGPDKLDNATEAEMLEFIKSVAVKTVHP